MPRNPKQTPEPAREKAAALDLGKVEHRHEWQRAAIVAGLQQLAMACDDRAFSLRRFERLLDVVESDVGNLRHETHRLAEAREDVRRARAGLPPIGLSPLGKRTRRAPEAA